MALPPGKLLIFRGSAEDSTSKQEGSRTLMHTLRVQGCAHHCSTPFEGPRGSSHERYCKTGEKLFLPHVMTLLGKVNSQVLSCLAPQDHFWLAFMWRLIPGVVKLPLREPWHLLTRIYNFMDLSANHTTGLSWILMWQATSTSQTGLSLKSTCPKSLLNSFGLWVP